MSREQQLPYAPRTQKGSPGTSALLEPRGSILAPKARAACGQKRGSGWMRPAAVHHAAPTTRNHRSLCLVSRHLQRRSWRDNIFLVPRLLVSVPVLRIWRGPGRGSPTRRRALPGVGTPLTAAGAQLASLRRGLGPRLGARRGRPGQAASRVPSSVKTRPLPLSAGSRAKEHGARLRRKGARRRAQATAKPPRKRGSGTGQRTQGVQGGDPPTLACCATLAAPTPAHPLRSRSPPAPGGAGKSRPPPPTSRVRHWGSRAGLRAPLAPRLTQTGPPGERAGWRAHGWDKSPKCSAWGRGAEGSQFRILHLGTLRVPHAEEGGHSECRC